jgi:hypothetical protein
MKGREFCDRAAARRALGSPLLLRTRAYQAWGRRWLDDVWWDMHYAVRMFRHSPSFTAVALLTLALGIAVNTTVFTVTNAVLFNGFPHVDPDDRIRYIVTRSVARPARGLEPHPIMCLAPGTRRRCFTTAACSS